MPLARLLRFAAVMLFACLCTQTHADVVIVEDGVSQAPIVVFPDAPPRTRAAAVELVADTLRVWKPYYGNLTPEDAVEMMLGIVNLFDVFRDPHEKLPCPGSS